MNNFTDIITYSGAITTQGYEEICNALTNKKSDKAILVLATPGGDPHAGFRIARSLQCVYEKFDVLIPRYCKSAGTLITIGASTIYMDDMSELGPLDIQIKKGDELIGRNSGLDIFQAVTYLQSQSMNAFKSYLLELTQETGLSTRIASEIASRLTSELFEPIAAQIDPIKLAEMQRASEIAIHYGMLLNEKSNNIRQNGISRLVASYPSHGFVIDRKEARNIFIKVLKPTGCLELLSSSLKTSMTDNMNSQSPQIQLFTIPSIENDDSANTTDSSSNIPVGESSVDGNSQTTQSTETNAEANAGKQSED